MSRLTRRGFIGQSLRAGAVLGAASALPQLASGRPYNRSFSTPQGFVTEFGVSRAPSESFLIPQAFAYRTLDLRLRKDFVDVGGNRLGVTLDAFNFYNTRNLGCYGDFAGSFDNAGKFTPNAGFGVPTCTIADPRRVQIGVSSHFFLISGRTFCGDARRNGSAIELNGGTP